MASVPGRQKPDLDLVGKDPNYHPCNDGGWWNKDAMLNNCSASMLSGLDGVKNWEKFEEYFWHNKGEGQDLQTPGMMVVTLTSEQKSTIRWVIEHGFEPIFFFPSCHGGHRSIVMLVKKNPVIMKSTIAQESEKYFRQEVAEMVKEFTQKQAKTKEEPAVAVVPAAPKPKRKPKPRVYVDVMEDNL